MSFVGLLVKHPVSDLWTFDQREEKQTPAYSLTIYILHSTDPTVFISIWCGFVVNHFLLNFLLFVGVRDGQFSILELVEALR